MSEIRQYAPTPSSGIQTGTSVQKKSSSNEGLNSILGSKPPTEPVLTDSSELIGQLDDSQGLKTISKVLDKPLSEPVSQNPHKDDVRAAPPPNKASPFSTDKTAVKPNAQDHKDLTPDKGWASNIQKYATGAKKSLAFPGHHEKKMTTLGTAFGNAAKGAGGDADLRSFQLSKALKTQLDNGASLLPSNNNLSTGAKEIRQAHMVLQSLLAQTGKQDNSVTGSDVMRAVLLLPAEDQRTLLRADALTGGDLYNLAYTAQKTDADLKPLFNTLKAEAAVAQVSIALDRHDPSGESGKVFNDFINHLEGQNYREGLQQDFKNHLAFQMKLGDVTLPDTSKAGWRQEFSAELISRFCGLETASSTDRAQMLDLPKADLLLTMAKALGTGPDPSRLDSKFERREGDVHILRTLRDHSNQVGTTLGDTDKAIMARLLPRLESGGLNPGMLVEELKAGTALDKIETKLNADHQTQVTSTTKAVNKALTSLGKRLSERRKTLENQLPKPEGNGSAPKLLQDRDAAKARYELKTIKANQALLKDFSVSEKQISKFMDRFGLDSLRPPNFNPDGELLRQFTTHLGALENPALLKDGLKNLLPVLPTAGKPLESFHWVDSTVHDMVAMAQDIRTKDDKFSLANNPVIILDQSDGDGSNAAKNARWKENDDYLNTLQAQHKDVGLKIVHVSMQEINKMIKGSGLEKLFDTTGQGFAGYGGARNMAFLLTPVISKAIQEGESLDSIKPDTLRKAIQTTAMTSDAPKLFMGDDTDYIRPGGLFAKAGINKLYNNEYYTTVSRRDGRDTTAVSPLYASIDKGTLDKHGLGNTMSSFGNSRWNSKLVTPGMGSVMGAPRFCFDIPTGSEEKHHTATHNHVDAFSRVSHLSGDRMKPVENNIQGYLNYSLGTEMFQAIGNGADPWNGDFFKGRVVDTPPFDKLGDVLGQAADTTVIQATQVNFLSRMADQILNPKPTGGPFVFNKSYVEGIEQYLQDNPGLAPEEQDQLTNIRDTYQNVLRQFDLIKGFGNDVLGQLVPKFAELSSEERSKALAEAIQSDGGKKATATIAAAKKTLKEDDKIIDLTQGNNQILRDFLLIADSLGGGGFGQLAGELLKS